MKKASEYVLQFEEDFVSSTGISKQTEIDLKYIISLAQKEAIETTIFNMETQGFSGAIVKDILFKIIDNEES